MTTIPYGMEAAVTNQDVVIFSALLQLLISYITVAVILGLCIAVLMIISSWCIFKKAGTGGWKALIPVYSDYTFYKIAWKGKYFFLMLFFAILGSTAISLSEQLPEYAVILYVVGIILNIIAIIIDIKSIVKLAKIFGKSGGFAVGIIFLPVIFLPILGFGKAKYKRRKRRRKKALPPPESI